MGLAVFIRDDNGSAGHGSRVKWVNRSGWVTWVTGQYLTRDQVNKIPRTGYFVLDFETLPLSGPDWKLQQSGVMTRE